MFGIPPGPEDSITPKVCAICWSNLPSNCKALPCNHQFCKGCINDLLKHHKQKETTAKCPMCRGPVSKPTLKSLWKEFERHEAAANDLILSHHESRNQDDLMTMTSTLEQAQRESDKAVELLEQCLPLLFSHRKKQMRIKTLAKLLELHPMMSSENQSHKSKEVVPWLKQLLKLQYSPLNHVKLAKTLHQNQKHTEAIHEYNMVLRNKKAKHLRGVIHHGLGLCHHRLEDYEAASRHYDLCFKLDHLKDYASAAENMPIQKVGIRL
jgi:tetratricopeptide (TPR) repeat protein